MHDSQLQHLVVSKIRQGKQEQSFPSSALSAKRARCSRHQHNLSSFQKKKVALPSFFMQRMFFCAAASLGALIPVMGILGKDKNKHVRQENAFFLSVLFKDTEQKESHKFASLCSLTTSSKKQKKALLKERHQGARDGTLPMTRQHADMRSDVFNIASAPVVEYACSAMFHL